MTTYRGMDGFLSIGGRLFATAGPLVNGALTAGATSLNLDGTSLVGVVAVGDTFTLAGEAGSPVHTVTGGPFYVAAANAITGLTFTPAVAAGGVADNAAITFVSNSVAEAKVHSVNADIEMLEDTSMGDGWRTFQGGLAQWQGSGEVWLDKGDTKQSALIDKILTGSPSPSLNGVLFGYSTRKQWYAQAVLSGFQVAGAQLGALVSATFNFQGTGAILPNWN